MLRNNEEYKIHLGIVKHHATAFPHVKLLYVPNAVRDASDAYFNKMMGAQPGAHDLFLFWQHGNYGIFEVKSRYGKLSTPQNKFASSIAVLGGKTGFGDSVEKYHGTLLSWGIQSRHNSIIEPDLRTHEEKIKDNFDFFKR